MKFNFTLTALLLTGVMTGAYAQLTGTKSIPGDYSSIALAITDLNTQGVGSGGVTFNVAAGYTEILTARLNMTATGTAADPIVFQKSGSGANPIITSYTGTALATATTTDGMWALVGSDYVTIDGIDLQEAAGNTTATTTMEYGYGLFKASATDGASNNIIRNCVITLNRVNSTAPTSGPAFQGSNGIALLACTPTAVPTTITVTAASGASSNNKFYSNTIQNVNAGISMSGYAGASPFTLCDTGNDIGGSSAGTGNTIVNFGGGTGATVACAAVFVKDQWSFNVSYNFVMNNDGNGVNHPATNRGIFANPSSIGASATINNNTVFITGGSSTTAIDWAIDCEMAQSGNASGNTISINNNAVRISKATATAVALTAIWVQSAPATMNISGNNVSIYNAALNTSTSTTDVGVIRSGLAGIGTLNITNNTIGGVTFGGTTGNAYVIGVTGAPNTALNITGNNINGVTLSGVTSKVFRAIYISGAATTCAHDISNNTFQNISYSGGTPTGLFSLIYALGTASSYTISDNTLSGTITVPTTGSTYLIYNSQATPNLTINNNALTGTGFTRTGASGTFYGYYNFGGPSGGTSILSNNNVSKVTLSGTSAFYGLYHGTSTTQILKVQGNTIFNITGGSGAVIGIHHNYGAVGSEAKLNTVYNLSGTGTVTGIQFGNSTASLGLSVFDNQVYGLASTGASTVAGMIHTNGASSNIYRNKIYDITTNNAGGFAYGLQVAGGTTITAYNNLIGDIKGPILNAAISLAGINVSGGTTVNLYNNSVNLNATSSGVLFGSAAVYASSTPTLTMRNNLLVNTSTPVGATGFTAAYRRTSTTLTSYGNASNNNLFYAGTPGANNLIFYDGTNSSQTLGDYKTLVGPTRDVSSVSENLAGKFLSTSGISANFLHIDPAIATQVEGGGSNIASVTDDYDLDVRNASTPDIGADEFAGTPASPVFGTTTITPSTTQCVAMARNISAEVSPAAGSTISSVNLNYSINGAAQTPIVMTLSSGSASALGVYTATIPVVTPGNATVAWSVEAFSGALNKVVLGTSYQDEPNTGVTSAISATVNPTCAGSPTVLSTTVIAAGSATVGAGATTSATYSNPFYSAWSNSHNQHLILASELTAAGIFAGNITSLGMDVTVIGTLPMINLTVGLAHTSATNMSAYVAPAFTTVYTNASMMPIAGVNMMTFSTPFYWDGVSNLVIDICHDNLTATTTMSRTCRADNTSFVSSIHVHRTTVTGTSICGNTATNLTTYSVRPRFFFNANVVVTPSAYLWSTGATTATVTDSPTATTAYTVTTTLNGCPIVSSSYTVTATPLPAAVTASAPSTQCGLAIPTVSVSSNTGATTPVFNWYAASTGGSPLQTGTSNTYLTEISSTTTFYVSELYNGCESPRVAAVANVTTPDGVSFTAPATICIGTPINVTATQSGSLNNYIYTWDASPATGSGVSGTPSGATQSFSASAQGTFVYTVSATDASAGCLTSYSQTVTVFPGITGTASVASQPNACPGTGLIATSVSGAGTIVNNDFTSTALPANMTSAGNDFAITGGKMQFTSAQNSKNGGVLITNPTGLANDDFQIDFDMITTPGTSPVADGFSYSYGPDVVALPTGTGSTTVNTTVAPGTTNPENGSGTKLKLSFDAYTNGANAEGIYLMYNSPIWNQSSANTPTQGLLYYANNTSWKATTTTGATTHVTIKINNLGQVSMWLNGLLVVTNQQLPASYLTDDKSTWSHAFCARTGSLNQGHYIDNLLIQYNNFYEYSLNSTTWTTTTPLVAAPGTYNVSARYVSVPACTASLGSVTIDPVTITAAASQTNVCAGQTTNLTASPSVFVGSTYFWESSPMGANTFAPISGATTAAYTATVSASSDFRCVVDCGGGTTFTSNIVTVVANNPTILSTTPASRCGTGTVTLQATADAGSVVSWYTAATGGSAVATGTSFTTPILSTTTDYYVAASSGGATLNTSKLTYEAASTATVLTTYGQDFTVTSGFTLNSVQVFSTTGTSITISLYSAGGTTQLQTTGAVSVVAGSSPNINLGWYIAPGTYRLCANGMTGNFYRDNTGVTYPFALSSIGTMNGFVSSITGTVTTSSSYYFMYNWSVTTGCFSGRTLVTATVTPAAALTITGDATICNGAVTPLSITSNTADFDSYTWAPTTYLFTDMAGTTPYTGGSATTVYFKSTTAGAASVTCTANNTVSGCANVASVNLTVMPNPNISSSPSNICVSGSATVSVSPSTGYGAGSFQWQESPSGTAGTYTDIIGQTTGGYTTPVLTSSAYYALVLKDGSNNVCATPTYTMEVNNPLILSTTPGTRCGTGTVVLGATPSAGATVNWYTAATGGQSIGTGNSFTTPIISANTTYYAAAGVGSNTFNTSKLTYEAASSATSLSTYGQDFTVTSGFTLNNVQVFSTTGTSITVSLYSAGGTTQLQTTGAVPVVAGSSPNINLGWYIAPGTYRLCANGMTGNFYRDNTGVTYPFALSTVGTMNGFVSAITGTVTTSTSYYFLYNWSISVGCESPRSAVAATITTGPSLSVSGNNTVCNGGVMPINVTSNLADFDEYTWSPASVLYTDPGATTAYVAGTSAATVYLKSTTAGNVTVTCVSNNTTSGCGGAATTVATVLPSAYTIAGTQSQACLSGSTTLSLSPTTGMGSATYQWQSSTDASLYTNIAAANANTYNASAVTTTYYKAIVSDGVGNTCASQPIFTYTVTNPTVVSVTGAGRCDAGTLTLGATPSAGATIDWYAAAIGGTSLGTGNTFTTPSISATTNYYAQAKVAGTAYIGLLPTTTTCGTVTNSTATDWPLRFNTSAPTTLRTVQVVASVAGSYTFALRNALSSTNITTTTATLTVGTNTVTLNWAIPTSGNYQITSTTGNLNRIGTFTCSYPYTTPSGTASIVGSATTSTSTTNTTTYNCFYNLQFDESCTAATRTPVTATINTPPTAVSVTGVTHNTAVVNWTPGPVSTTYTIEYGLAGFTPGTGTIVTGALGASVPPRTITGLTFSTAYDVYVHEGCSSGVQTAATGPISFATTAGPPPANDVICGALSMPLPTGTTMGFGTYTTLSNTKNCNTITGNTVNATVKATLPATSCGTNGKGLWYKFTTPGCSVSGVSPFAIQVSTSNSSTNFDTKVRVFSSSDNTCNGTLTEVGCDNDGGDPTLGCEGGLSNSSLYNFSTAVPGSTYFVYVDGNSASAGGTFELSLFVDVTPPTVTANPTNPSTQMDISWNDMNAAVYTMYYRPQGFSGYSGITRTNNTPYTTPSVNPGTTYDVQLIPRCTSNGQQFYSPLVSHTTDPIVNCGGVTDLTCGTATSTSFTVSCTHQTGIIPNGYHLFWRVQGSAGYSGRYNAPYTVVGNNAVFTQSANLLPGTTYEIWIYSVCATNYAVKSNTVACSTMPPLTPMVAEANGNENHQDLFTFEHEGVEYHNVKLDELTYYGFPFSAPSGDVTATYNIVDGKLVQSSFTGSNLLDSQSFDFVLMPNPTSDQTTVLISAEGVQSEAVISVVDALGRVISTQNVSLMTNGTNVSLETSHLANGVYNVCVKTNSQVVSKKLVVQH